MYLAVSFLVLVALAEATVLPYARLGGVQPDLTLLVVGGWSLRRGVEEGAAWAFVAGIILDLLSAGPHTALILALLTVSLILGIDPSTGVGRMRTRPFGGNPLALILAVVLATGAFHAVLLVAMELAGRPGDWLDAVSRVVLPRMVVNLILMPLVYGALGWLDRRTRHEQYVL